MLLPPGWQGILNPGYVRSVMLICIILTSTGLSAQVFNEYQILQYDTSYIQVYRDELTTRIFLSGKQNGYNLSERLFSPWIKYRTNDQYQIGIGYTYNFLTLNVGFKLPVFNSDDALYDKSRGIDLQSHTIFRNMIMDLYLQWNRGYYLSNLEDQRRLTVTDTRFPVRGDLRTSIVGINIQRLFNSERYSYKASFVQNEFQKRSAGSPMLGVEGYWMLGMADSLIIPASVDRSDFAEGVEFNQADLFHLGINAGYAYTFVVRESLYFSLSTTWGLAAGTCVLNNTATSELNRSGISLGVNSHNRASIGFNKKSFYIGLSFIHFYTSQNYGYKKGWFSYSSGNLRLNVVKRFRLHRPIKILRPDLWIF